MRISSIANNSIVRPYLNTKTNVNPEFKGVKQNSATNKMAVEVYATIVAAIAAFLSILEDVYKIEEKNYGEMTEQQKDAHIDYLAQRERMY